jgi:branched-chain amino acid transport system ATP-binding protein
MQPLPAPANGLRLSGVGVRFGGLVALEDVSVDVPAGGVVGVIGPNGAGKTTLFNVVCGFVTPFAGTMHWAGRPLRPRPHRLVRLGIARTLQGVGLFGGLTVAENVMVGAGGGGFAGALFGLPTSDRAERRLRAAALTQLDALGVARYADDLPAALPFALRKRVALARALAARPRLLLLDEPAGGLSGLEVEELVELIRGLPASAGCAVLLVEHHMDLVMAVCHEIVVLDFGRVIARGSPDEIRADPAVAEAYLGAETGEEAA